MEPEILPMSSGMKWQLGQADNAVVTIYAQLSDETYSLTLDLAPCGPEVIAQLRRCADPSCPEVEANHILEHLENISDKGIKSNAKTHKFVPLHMRRLYTDCRLLHSLIDLRDHPECDDEDVWLGAVARLDMAIIVSGAPGDGRLDLILDTMALIQSQHLPFVNPAAESIFTLISTPSPGLTVSIASKPIPHIEAPSLSTFRNKFSSEPFILPGYIRDWPALNDHPWHSSGYLQRIAGRGRIVPVEVGSDYREEGWNQKLIPWEEFLREIGVSPHMDYLKNAKLEAQSGDSQPGKEPLYLAQHTLLTQFPTLRSDILVPDYVYTSPPAPPTFPGYRPPRTEEQLIINAWLGPRGTVSPAHTDPYFNCYAQVVGRKTVWLAPPHFQEEMYPFVNPHAPHTAREPEDGASQDAKVQNTEASLTNTSHVDVFMSSDVQFPLYMAHVLPRALCAILEPGDLLYIPPGWWHAMRSEDVSFSVSMWF